MDILPVSSVTTPKCHLSPRPASPSHVWSQGSSTIEGSKKGSGGGFFSCCFGVILWPFKQLLNLSRMIFGCFCCCCTKDYQRALVQVTEICDFLSKQKTATAAGEKTYKDLLADLPKWVVSLLIEEELKELASQAGQGDEKDLSKWLEANTESQTPFIKQWVNGYQDHLEKLSDVFARLKTRLESHQS